MRKNLNTGHGDLALFYYAGREELDLLENVETIWSSTLVSIVT